VVLGWNATITTRERVFGTVLDNVLNNTEQMVLVSKIIHPINTTKKIVVAVPEAAELEEGFVRWIQTIKILATQAGTPVNFFSCRSTLTKIKSVAESTKPSIEATYTGFIEWRDFLIIAKEVDPDDLLIVVSARPGTLSYNSHLDSIPRLLAKHFQENSFVIMFPTQNILKIPSIFQ
jgi:hypothetical protein